MDVNIKSIHFDATEKLQDFIIKKINRLARHNESISNAEVTLKVVKPETSMNKEAGIKISVPQQDDIFASKVANSFEEAVDLSIEALERQLEKIKGRKKYNTKSRFDNNIKTGAAKCGPCSFYLNRFS